MAAAPPEILVIDDSEDIRELCQLALEAAGYRVRVAAHGVEGLAAARDHRPDVIITDISMPVMDGFQFLVHLRSDFAPPLPPVVVCSGFDIAGEKALRFGATRVVSKPVEPAFLIEIVEEALRGQPPSEASLQTAHERVRTARERAVAAAARLFATVEAQVPDLDRVTSLVAQRISDYFGFGSAGVVFVQSEGQIRVAGVSGNSVIPAGTTFSGNLLFATGVLAAGSSFLATDSFDSFRALGADPNVTSFGFKFFAAVPLFFEGVSIGTLCLFDTAAHSFDAEDLLVLEGIGHDVARHLVRFAAGKHVDFFSAQLFERMLGAELSLLHRNRGQLELLLVDLEPEAVSLELSREILKSGGPRLALCRREMGVLAIYKRDSITVEPTIAAVLSTLQSSGAMRASGSVSIVDDGMPPVPEDVVLRLAGFALEESRAGDAGRAEHIVLGRGPARETVNAAAP
jgi:CheY-like chemotaxis protein